MTTAKTTERMTWDHRADHDLLTAIMQELQPSQEQLRGVMQRMHGFGYTCTLKAITYRFLPGLVSPGFLFSPSAFSPDSLPEVPLVLSFSKWKIRKRAANSASSQLQTAPSEAPPQGEQRGRRRRRQRRRLGVRRLDPQDPSAARRRQEGAGKRLKAQARRDRRRLRGGRKASYQKGEKGDQEGGRRQEGGAR